jgi:hypothetical protein
VHRAPGRTSRADVLRAGAQVVVVGGCAEGWASHVFDWDDVHVESGSTAAYRPFPECDPTYGREVYAAKLVRYYEDSTFVADAIDPTAPPEDPEALTPAKTRQMVRCGVDLLGFDQLLPDDGRLGAAVWSWARDRPRRGRSGCAVQSPDSRWVVGSCGTRRRAACRTRGGAWRLTRTRVRHNAARQACRRRRARFAAPRSGHENALLRAAAGRKRIALAVRVR